MMREAAKGGSGCSQSTGLLEGVRRDGSSGIKSKDTHKGAYGDHFDAVLETPNIKSLALPCLCVGPEPTLSRLHG